MLGWEALRWGRAEKVRAYRKIVSSAMARKVMGRLMKSWDMAAGRCRGNF